MPEEAKGGQQEIIWERRAAAGSGSGIMQGLGGHVRNGDAMPRAMGSQSVARSHLFFP